MATETLILDTASAELATFFADHAPASGGALLGPRSINAISHFVPDHYADACATSYTSSDELVLMVNELETSESVELKGIAHSHRGSLNRPPDLDWQAADGALAASPHLPRYLIPSITLRAGCAFKSSELDLLNDPGALGSPEGDMVSSFTARLRAHSGVTIEPTRLRIHHVGSSLAAAAELLAASRISSPRPVDYAGTPLLAADLTAEDGDEWDFMFPWTSLFAPMIFRDGELLTVDWDFEIPKQERLASALERRLKRDHTGLPRGIHD